MRDGPHWALALPLLVLIALPLAALGLSSSPEEILAGARSPLLLPALWLSVRTSFTSVLLIVIAGTPLAWWMATRPPHKVRPVQMLTDLPVVIPPAVMGIALLEALGRGGVFHWAFEGAGIRIPFTSAAVVLAQIVVSAPFYVQSAASAIRGVDPDVILAARTLGQSKWGAFVRVTLPIALPGALTGIALSWARALGEFGATLFFAGNLPGTTQTLPLAIYSALESDVRAAVSLALILAGAGVMLLLPLRAAPGLWAKRLGKKETR